jgi:hypothetical protein
VLFGGVGSVGVAFVDPFRNVVIPLDHRLDVQRVKVGDPSNIVTMNPSHPETPYAEPIKGTRRSTSPSDGKPAKSQRSKTESPSINRPPMPPPAIIGPYFQFLTTEGHNWHGSALVLHRGE